MIVRKIRPEEYKRAQELSAHAFEYRWADSERSVQELLEKIERKPEYEGDIHWQSRWAAFEDDDKTMLSTFIAIPYRAHFDGHDVLMMGIGGVATLPQYRKRGGIRKCFEAALPDMYAQGAALSYLYPFSTAFYRKFGYELGCERNRYKLRLSGMPRMPVQGQCRLLEPGMAMKEDIRRIDAVWAWRYNLMTLDGEIEYQWIDKANPFRDAVYTYVYYGKDGTPRGYMTYKPTKDAGDDTLECSRFCFADLEGFYGLMNLLISQMANHSHVIMRLPTDVELGAILPEWSMDMIACQREQAGMLRVVNVEKALRMAHIRGTGRLVIEVVDEQIEHNTGRFEVRYAHGAATSVCRCEETADIELTIQDFSRLICGRYDMEALAYLPQVKLHCAPQKAAQVFYRKPMYITRPF